MPLIDDDFKDATDDSTEQTTSHLPAPAPIETSHILPNSIQPTINSAFESQTPYDVRHPRKVMLDKLVLDLCVRDMQPLSVVEDIGFRTLVNALDKRYTIVARKTLRDSLLPRVYKERKSALFLDMSAVDHVGITTDQWTSRANEGYTTVTCHFTRDDWTLASPVLATRSSGARHSGENMADELAEIFTEFGITNKVTSIVTDNAKNAKKAVRITEKDNQPCFAHTLNLIVTHSLEDDESAASDIHDVKQIALFFKQSVQATRELKKVHEKNGSIFKKIKNDVKTRWNSTFIMLQSYLPQHKEVKAVLCLLDKTDLVIKDVAIARLKKTMATLEPFFLATEELSCEKHTSISKVLTLIKMLNGSTAHQTDQLSTLLHKYCHLYLGASEDRPLLRQASYLDPRYKDYPFTSKKTLDKTIKEIRSRLMMTKGEEKRTEDSQPTPPPPKKTNALWQLFDEDNTVSIIEATPEALINTELQLYSDAQRLNRRADPLQWWKKQSLRLPNLAKLAKELLTVPATSVPSERVFSKAGELISAKRSRLGKETVDRILFLNKYK